MLDLLHPPALSPQQRRFWDKWGYLHLEKAVSPNEISRIQRTVDWHWANPAQNPHHIDVLTGEHAGKWFTMHDAPSSIRNDVYKLNNLFLHGDSIRAVALSPRLKRVIKHLLQAEPLICNSLNFERGSQQDAHIDSWYMCPPKDEGMVAASISLDPVDETNGPIFFYPGSHKIPPYRFSDGRLNMISDEFDACRAYLDSEISARKLKTVRFRGEPGDVFIWHGQLIHGGSEIRDLKRTRNSLVVHYWRASDLPKDAIRRDAKGRAYLAHTLRGELPTAELIHVTPP